MPLSHPHSDNSSSSSGSASESFCLSSCSDYDSDFQALPSIQPNLETKLQLTSKADPTIYSFAWSESNLENHSNHSEIVRSSMSTYGLIDPRGTPPPLPAAKDHRRAPPPLPRPICWTCLTHPEIFKEYISAEGLRRYRGDSNTPSVATEETQGTTRETTRETARGMQEPLSKNYSNAEHINAANTNKYKIVANASSDWVYHLLETKHLPVPFNPTLVSEDQELWLKRNLQQIGDHTFRKLPDITTEKSAMEWCNSVGRSLGVIHNLVSSTNSSDQALRSDQSKTHPVRIFDDGGCNKPLHGGFLKRKPDIILIDPTKRDLTSNGCVRWPLVQALVEVSIQPNHYHSLMDTLLSKAAVIFDSQLHRQYILGLAFFGKDADIKFFFTLIDRAGAVCTTPSHIKGYDALILARIIFAFTYGNDQLLGIDPRVTIDHITGDPIEVLIDNQRFTIVQEIHSSPYLFGRGTRVYIVKDAHGHFHVFKDSWIIATHESSEIDHIKQISSMANAEGSTDNRFRFLRPRFVAGENHVDDTNKPRGYVTTLSPARIRRRIVTGPIGDPITSYRSRVECLQALIDVVDQLVFLHDKCGLVHGDISISNVVIVRFLPSILAASDAAMHQPSTTAGEQLADAPPSESSSGNSPTTTSVNPVIGNSNSLSFGSEDNNLILWETAQPSTDTGLPLSLGSGGSVIDFDYSRPKNTASAKTSGTMPYMSIELMLPSQPLEHRLDHDLESVLLVLLHIARFTCGPTANPIDEVKSSFNISLWHHEAAVELVHRHKVADISDIHKDPKKFITNYWNPIAPYLIKLIDVIYPRAERCEMVTGSGTCSAFKEVLVAARDHCKALQEQTPNYASFVTKKRKSSAQDRGKTKQSRPPRNTVGTTARARPGPGRVSRSQRQASGPAD